MSSMARLFDIALNLVLPESLWCPGQRLHRIQVGASDKSTLRGNN